MVHITECPNYGVQIRVDFVIQGQSIFLSRLRLLSPFIDLPLLQSFVMSSTPGNGCIHTGLLKSLSVVVAVVGLCCIAMFNSIELVITTFMTFKRRSGLYFYSLLVATSGVFTYALFILIYFLVFGIIN